jgi:ubiquinone/menaquinone biosynthesis C-methylase UbiE
MTKLKLRCPHCTADLVREIASEGYTCSQCGRTFPERKGIPCLLPDEFDTSVAERYERDGKQVREAAAAVGYTSGRQHRLMTTVVTSLVLKFVSGGRVLDLGCGHGKFTAGLTDNYEVVGIDLAHAMLLRARSEGLDVYQADVKALPFADEQFDAVVCAEVIQHLDDLAPLAGEVARVLCPGGIGIVTTLNSYSLLRRLYRLFTIFSFHPHWRNALEVIGPFETAGLNMEQVVWTHFPFYFTSTTKNDRYIFSVLASNIIVCLKRE